MRKILSAVVPLLISFPAFAAMDESAANAPTEVVDVIYVVIFGIIFVGMIVGFCHRLATSDEIYEFLDIRV